MGQQGDLVRMMLPLAMFAAIFYFLIMRPQKKKQKAHEDMIANISKGSEVVTAGGFFGIVREVLDDSYIIEMAEGVKVRILKSSISIRRTNEGEKSDAPKKKRKKRRREDVAISPDTATVAAVSVDETVVIETEVVESVEAVCQQRENNEEKA